MWRHLLTKLASYKVPLVMVSTHGSVVPLAMFSINCYVRLFAKATHPHSSRFNNVPIMDIQLGTVENHGRTKCEIHLQRFQACFC